MASSAIPAVNKNGSRRNTNGAFTGNHNVSNGVRSAVPENYRMVLSHGLVRDVDISVDWSRDEQFLLEELLAKYALDRPELRYATIARNLPGKSARDVAYRCKWMRESGKKIGNRRRNDIGSSRKQKDKREKVAEQQVKPSSHATIRAPGVPYGQLSTSIDNNDAICYNDLGGETGYLLKQNAQALDQISANMSAMKIHENIHLFAQTRSNIITLLNEVNKPSEVMDKMPPLLMKLEDELFSSILSQSYMP